MSSYATQHPSELASSTRRGGFLRVWMVVAAFVVVGTAVSVVLHSQRYGGISIGQLLLVLFLWINVLVTFLEISLYLQIKLIKEHYAEFVPAYRGREMDRLVEFMTAPIRWSDAASASLGRGLGDLRAVRRRICEQEGVRILGRHRQRVFHADPVSAVHLWPDV